MIGPGLLDGLLGLPPFGFAAAGAGGAAPDAPANLTATAVSGSQIDLSWDASDGATGYRLERSTNGVDFTEIIDQAGVTYSNTGLSGVLTFTYRVIAYDAVGDSAPSDTATVEYYQRIAATQAANFIAGWRQNETSGLIADNFEGTAARDGAYSAGVELNNALFINGDPVPFFNSDYMNAFSASFASAFTGAELTISLWAKAVDAAMWTDGASRDLFYFTAGGGIAFRLTKVANNTLQMQYRVVVSKDSNVAISTTDWFNIAVTISEAADEMKVYLNKVQVGVTATGLGAWAHTLTIALIGAFTTSPNFPWHGWISNVGIWTKPLTLAEIEALNP